MANPYRDEFGRFTKKENAVEGGQQTEEQKPKFNKKKAALIAGGVIASAAVLGVSAYYGHKYLKDVGIKDILHEVNNNILKTRSSGTKIEKIDIEQRLNGTNTEKDVDNSKVVSEGLSIAVNALAGIGVKINPHVKINVHKDFDSFADAVGRDFSVSQKESMARRFANATNVEGYYDPASKTVNLSNSQYIRLSGSSKLGKTQAIAVAAHEYYHSYSSFLDDGLKSRGRSFGESLARSVESIVYARVSEDRNLDSPLSKEDFLSSTYRSQAKNNWQNKIFQKQLFKLAGQAYAHDLAKYKSNKEYANVYDIVTEWITDPDTLRKFLNRWEVYDVPYLRYEDNNSIILYNPYHDELGRFTTKEGFLGVANKINDNIIKNPHLNKSALDVIGGYAGSMAPVGSKTLVKNYATKDLRKRQKLIDKETLSEVDYKNKYQNLPGYAKDLLLNPAEALTRKGSRKAKAAMFAIDIGSDLIIRSIVRSLMFGAAYSAGAALTATAIGSLLGTTAPLWAVQVGGVVVGLGAVGVTSSIIDYGTSKILNHWIDSASPNDRHHIKLSGFAGTKRKLRTKALVSLAHLPTLPGAIIGEVLGVGLDAYSIAGDVTLEISKEEYDANEGARLFSSDLYPFIVDLLLYEDAPYVFVPIYDPRLEEFGFERVDDKSMYLYKDGALKFAKNWSTGNFPNIDNIHWGNTEISIDQTKLEDSITLYNPYRDELGRFASKNSNFFGFGNRPKSRGLNSSELAPLLRKNVETSARLENGGINDIVAPSWGGVYKYDKNKTAARQSFGMYSPRHNKIILTPNIRNLSKEEQEYVIAHETIHSRPRLGGKPATFKTYEQIMVEEGLTEVINVGLNGPKIFYLSPYQEHAYGMAKMARHNSNGDRKQAWEWVKQAHIKNGDPNYSKEITGGANYRQISDFFLRSGKDDLEWMLANPNDIPYKLEDISFDQQMILSEIAKYKILFNIDIKEIFNAD